MLITRVRAVFRAFLPYAAVLTLGMIPIRVSAQVEDRKLHFGLGAGTDKALFATIQWFTPVSDDRSNLFVNDLTVGYRPGRESLVFSTSLTFLSIRSSHSLGILLGLNMSTERWMGGEERISQFAFSLTPGMVVRVGGGLLRVAAGPNRQARSRDVLGTNFLRRTRERSYGFSVETSYIY